MTTATSAPAAAVRDDTEADAGDGPVWRMRLVAGALLLTALAFRQAGGLVVPDTKFDLTADPAALLSRALHLWDPLGAMGQLQNQAYGYLIPAGPFHWALTGVGIPGWIVQRLWWSTILIIAFVGMWRLARAFGVRDLWAAYLAALAYAVGPRFISEVAVTSVEVWPLAVAPWVLLPLVDPRRRPMLRRVALSALAVAMVGGVNAVATGATLVLPAIWLLTRSPWRRALHNFAGWLACVLMATAWWLIPLLLLGRYSPPFLDWIENSSVTTAFASPFNALSGVTPWLNFLSGAGGPSWPGGWALVTNAFLIAVTALVAGLGLVGLGRSPQDQRLFLCLGLLCGLILVTAGHSGAAGGGPHAIIQDFLDGTGAPLRNTHKFELVIRVPLTVGLAWTLVAARKRSRQLDVPRWLGRITTVCIIVMMAAPGINGMLPRNEGYPAIPTYWQEAATWLDENAGSGTTLTVPGASFADFVWGSTKDDPLQAISQRPFVTRDAVPLGTAGTTRWLDTIEAELRAGRGGAKLRSALQLGGINHVLVRNDMRADASGSPDGNLLRVHWALAQAGLARSASFGPPMANPPGLAPESESATVDQRSRLAYPALEVFSLEANGDAYLVPRTGIAVVEGGAENAADVLSELPDVRATVVGSDVRDLPSHLQGAIQRVLTDGNTRREVFFGRATDNRSAVLAADDPGRTSRRVNDYVADPDAPQTVRTWRDPLLSVAASSSASDANAVIRRGPGYSPSAAIDGDVTTAWQSGTFASGVGEWLQLDFTRAVRASSVLLTLPPPTRTARPTEVSVTTDRGAATSVLSLSGGPQEVQVPLGQFRWLRITVTAIDSGSTLSGTGISEISIPGVTLQSSLAVPEPLGPVEGLVLGNDPTKQDCAWVVDRPVCVPGSGRSPEEASGLHRDLVLPRSVDGVMRGTVIARSGSFAERLLDENLPIKVQATSRATDDLAARPASVVDGSLGTGWIAAPLDTSPNLQLTFPAPVDLASLQFVRDRYLAASMPSQVSVRIDGGAAREFSVDEGGAVRFPAQPATSVSIQFLTQKPLTSIDSISGYARHLPVGVSEIIIPGVNDIRPMNLTSPTGAACGFGPELVISGRPYATEVAGVAGDLLSGAPLTWQTCSATQIHLPTGRVAVDADPTAEYLPLTMSVVPASPREQTDAITIDGKTINGVGDFAVPARSADSILVLPRNHNVGWTATTADGTLLQPVRINGWQQGYVVPAGGPTAVTVDFPADNAYRVGLGAGLVLLLCLVSGAAAAKRRPGVASARSAETLPVAQVVLVFVTMVVLGGWAGLAVGAAGVLIGALMSPRRRGLLILALVMGAAIVVAASPSWPSSRASIDTPVVQWLVMAGVALALTPTALLPARMTGSLRLPQRMMGRSTK